MASTEKEQIRVQMEELLRRLYPDALSEGSKFGLGEIDFLLEQCVITKKHDEESSQRRIIAIVSVEWARFVQNFNYKVSAGWFQWHDMMKQARARLSHLPEQNVEVEAKKLVKNGSIQRYGKEAYDAAQNTGSFLVEHADWNQIDALAKSICDKLQIKPDQLTILMVAGTQNNRPNPQLQGLCRHGHELRFCLVDDLERTMTSFFYERDLTESAAAAMLAHQPNASKPSLREILKAKPIVVGRQDSTPVHFEDLIILKLETQNERN